MRLKSFGLTLMTCLLFGGFTRLANAQSAGSCSGIFEHQAVLTFSDLNVKIITNHEAPLLSEMTLAARELFDLAGVQYKGGPPRDVGADQILTTKQMTFEISTKGTHRLNRFAKSIKEKLGVTVVYSLPDLIINDVLTGGNFQKEGRLLRMSRELPYLLKVDAIGAHEIGHAYFHHQTELKYNSYLAGGVIAKPGRKLPVGDSAKEYESYLQFDELWTYIMSIRHYFNGATKASSPEVYQHQLASSIKMARYTLALYQASAKVFNTILKEEANWTLKLYDRDYARIELETRDLEFRSDLVHPKAAAGFRLPRNLETADLNANPIVKNVQQAPLLTAKFRTQYESNLTAIRQNITILKKMLKTLETIESNVAPEERAQLLQQVNDQLTTVRSNIRPYIFSDDYIFE